MREIIKTTIKILGALALMASGLAQSQTYPSKPIKVFVPFAPGSGTDITARLFADELKNYLGVPVVIENRPGALGSLAAEAVTKAEPDGYTLMFTTSSTHSANQWLYKKLSYDPMKGFTPIARMAQWPFFLTVSTATGIGSFADFLKVMPKKNNLAMAYSNAIGQVAGSYLMKNAGFDAVMVPYKGSPPALVAMIGGEIDFMFVDLVAGGALMKDGKIRPLAVVGDKPSSLRPELPGLGETYPGFAFLAWGGLLGPAGMAPDVVKRLNSDVQKMLSQPALKARLESLGLEAYPSSPEEFRTFLVEQEAIWGKGIKAAGIKPE